MELILFVSAKNILSHIITEDLKFFIQIILHFQFFVFNFDEYCKNDFPVLHRVVLHYKFISVCNTWQILAVPDVIKQMEAIKSFGLLLALLTLFGFSNLLTEGQKNERMAIQEKARGVPSSVLRPSVRAAKVYCPFYGPEQTAASRLRFRVQSVFCACLVKSNTVVLFQPIYTSSR